MDPETQREGGVVTGHGQAHQKLGKRHAWHRVLPGARGSQLCRHPELGHLAARTEGRGDSPFLLLSASQFMGSCYGTQGR